MYKKLFPIFQNAQKPFVYFDSAATCQKPHMVINAMTHFYTTYNANPHRALYAIGERASQECSDVREKVVRFINASDSSEIIFTKGTTEGINFIATAWGMHNLTDKDSIVITELEHNANVVPWQEVAHHTGAQLVVIPIDKEGLIDIATLDTYITHTTKIVSVTQVSNALGMNTHVLLDIVKKARAVGAKVLIDGAQAIGYQKVDVQELDCDWYVFSGHKMLGPTGIGVLYMRKNIQDVIKPYQYGGSAVVDVSKNGYTLAQPPFCYEPGTLPVAEIVGLGAAIDCVQSIGIDTIHTHVSSLTNYALDQLQTIPGITMLGSISHLRAGAHMVSFTVNDMHAHDVAAFLDSKGICVRTGHHCAHLTAHALGYEASVRFSFHIYNTFDDITYAIDCLTLLLR